ncbi:hypothetical protein BSKO_11060 [Bryopsis sp. KO-2023]|nr:hypothetical protein BSKO_11060 [Bryopsis sp. KO-2023]
MLSTTGKKLGKGSSTSIPERDVLDLVAEELDGVWVGTTKPAALLNPWTSLPVCAEASSSCAKDTQLPLTITISGGKDFTYVVDPVEKDESAECSVPVIGERLSGTVTGFEENRLSISYGREALRFDTTEEVGSDLTEVGRSVLPEDQSACFTMEVYVDGDKVKADIKISNAYYGSLRGYAKFLADGGSAFSVCKDEILECDIDFGDVSSIVLQTQQFVTMECTSGKCLDLVG